MDCEEPSNRNSGGMDILALTDESLEATDKLPAQLALTPSTIGVFPPINPLGGVAYGVAKGGAA
jgi:hypothetical protein